MFIGIWTLCYHWVSLTIVFDDEEVDDDTRDRSIISGGTSRTRILEDLRRSLLLKEKVGDLLADP